MTPMMPLNNLAALRSLGPQSGTPMNPVATPQRPIQGFGGGQPMQPPMQPPIQQPWGGQPPMGGGMPGQMPTPSPVMGPFRPPMNPGMQNLNALQAIRAQMGLL